MKILVTGGAGYIGGTVSRLLMAAGHEVSIYDNLCHSRRSALPGGAHFIEGALADRTLLETVLSEGKFHGIMHFAALIEAGESMKYPEIYFRNNTAGTLSLLEAILATGAHKTAGLVFSSTAACYGEPETTPILENAKLAPTNPYGESKLLSETMMRWISLAHGLKFAALRYFNVAGAIEGYGENHEPESHLIPLILDVALGKRQNIKISARTTLPPTAPASATTSTSKTSPTPTCSLWKVSTAPPATASTTSATVRGSRCNRSSNQLVASPDIPSQSNSARAAPAIQPSSSPAPPPSRETSAGLPNTPTSTTSSEAPGAGTKSCTPEHPFCLTGGRVGFQPHHCSQ